MDGACSTYWGEERCIHGFGGETWEKRDYLEDPDLDGRIILKCLFRKWGWSVMDWIDLAQDGDRWRAVVKAVMNIRIP